MKDELRPTNLDEYIGQEKLKERLQISIDASKQRGTPMGHVFLYGPPGTGKTSLASLMANALDVPLEVITMPVNQRVLAQIVAEHEGVLVLDDLHRPSASRQEELLPLVEFGYIITSGGYKVEAGDLTIIGTTTDRTGVIAPLRERFSIRPAMDDYSDTEMGMIVQGMAKKADVPLTKDDCVDLGKATGGIPRNARQFVLAAKDVYEVEGVCPDAKTILNLCRVAPDGLTVDHLRHLSLLNENHGPMGLRPLSLLLEQDEDGVQDIERLLLKKKMIRYTDRGRELTNIGRTRIKHG